MRDLRAIVAAYEQLDTHLEGRRSAAATREGGRDRIATAIHRPGSVLAPAGP